MSLLSRPASLSQSDAREAPRPKLNAQAALAMLRAMRRRRDSRDRADMPGVLAASKVRAVRSTGHRALPLSAPAHERLQASPEIGRSAGLFGQVVQVVTIRPG